MEGERFAVEFTRPVHLTPLATSGRIEPSPPYLSKAGDETESYFTQPSDMSPNSIRSMMVSSINGLCGAMPRAAVRAALRLAKRPSQC